MTHRTYDPLRHKISYKADPITTAQKLMNEVNKQVSEEQAADLRAQRKAREKPTE